MMQAAIVEDNKQMGEMIRDALIRTFEQKQAPVAFDVFSEGSAFLSMFEQHYHYDFIFLDIEMPKLDGFEVCRRVRARKPDALVVFISSREELVFQSFEVQPFRFIRKSHLQESLNSLTDALLAEISHRQSRLIQVTEPVSGDIYSFDVNQILYIEAQRKLCRIVCQDHDTLVHCKFMELQELLKEEAFLQIHRSFLVNCKYIFHIGKTNVILTNREEVPLSRNRADEIRSAYLAYLSGNL